MIPNQVQSRFRNLALVMDFAKGGDFTAACFAAAMRDGTVMYQQSFRFMRGSAKMFRAHDMIDWTQYNPTRSGLKRHHKAKAQPNCGPRGNNPW